MQYLGRIAGEGVLTCNGETVARVAYDFEGFARPGGQLMSSGEIEAPAIHLQAVFGRPVEAAVLDPDNAYVLEPHLECAAAELPLKDADLDLFGPESELVVADLARRGRLRKRAGGWFWPPCLGQ